MCFSPLFIIRSHQLTIVSTITTVTMATKYHRHLISSALHLNSLGAVTREREAVTVISLNALGCQRSAFSWGGGWWCASQLHGSNKISDYYFESVFSWASPGTYPRIYLQPGRQHMAHSNGGNWDGFNKGNIYKDVSRGGRLSNELYSF